MTGWALGMTIGAVAGLGWWLIAWTWSRRQITLSERVAPYVRQRPRGSRLLAAAAAPSPFGPLGAIAAPLIRDLSRALERLGSSETSVAARLRQAGRAISVEQFRMEQIAWGSAGAGAGLVLALAIAGRGGGVVAGIVLVVAFGLAGAAAADVALTRRARSRTERILAELPEAAELTALAVGAGESPFEAIERVSRISSGELAAEFQDLVASVRAGTPFVRALESLSATTPSPELARFLDTIAVATERGTPLAAVLRDLAGDLRDGARARLLELGGVKEQAMLAPIVFMVLPITVIFALFPGLAALEVGL